MLFELKILVKNLLIEGKIEDLQVQYPDLDIKKISERDPSKSNKYLAWMVKQLSLGVKEADLYPTIQLFHNQQQRLKKRDIYQYSSLKELEDTLKDLGQSKRSKRKKIKSEGAEKIYGNEEYDVYFISSKNACITYGKETRWCITMKNAYYWEQYSENGYIFYFAIRKNPKGNELDKIAFAVGDREIEIEIFDAEDNELSISDVDSSVVQIINKDSKKRPKPFEWRVRNGILTQKEFYIIINNNERDSVIQLSKNANTSKEMLDEIINVYNNDRTVLYHVGYNPNVSKKSLIMLAENENEYVRLSVVENPKAPEEALAKLANDDKKEIRNAVASHFNTPQSSLLKLAKDEEFSVRERVARNSNASDKVLEFLFTNSSITSLFIKTSIAKNTKSENILLKLTKHRNPEIRENVAQNKNITLKIMNILSRDENRLVRELIARNKEIPKEIAVRLMKDEDSLVRRVLARNTKFLDVLSVLAEDANDRVREYVAKNFYIDSNVIKKLTSDHSVSVRRSLVRNRKINNRSFKNFLYILSQDEDSETRWIASDRLENLEL